MPIPQSEQAIRQKIREVVTVEFSLPDKDFDWDKLFSQLGFDSLDLVELLMQFEEVFEIEIPDEEFAELKTPEAVFAYAKAHGLIEDSPES